MRTYLQALDYLNQFINYERQRSAPYSAETLNLDRMRTLLDRLGNPHQAFPSIHVAGTKGKGSTAAMIDAILRAAGYRAGLYTSPHLHTFRERMRVNGELIARDAFAALVDEIEPHLAAVEGITWFEAITALGFLHFARSAIDIGVIEVGLGGRFDATNVITPRVSVITSLSMDHMAWLGDTLDQIAFEKAGIIKPGVPVVSAPQQAEALVVLERVAAERNAPLTVIDTPTLPHLLARYGSVGVDFVLDNLTLHVPLPGRHQVDNAALAVTAVRQTKELLIDGGAIARGLANVQWPGRFEIARRDPPLIFDCAHNADSAQKLVAALSNYFPDRHWMLIFGASSDKDIAGMLDALLPIADRVIVTRAKSARAADLESIAQRVAERHRSVEIASDVRGAIDLTVDTHAPIVVAGSIFVVAEAREAWFAHIGAPLPETDDQ